MKPGIVKKKQVAPTHLNVQTTQSGQLGAMGINTTFKPSVLLGSGSGRKEVVEDLYLQHWFQP